MRTKFTISTNDSIINANDKIIGNGLLVTLELANKDHIASIRRRALYSGVPGVKCLLAQLRSFESE